ncbi:latent-transforming growth factor beta-binding protein 1-like [Betta splendens]|uniref:Latent-transforming growth factor beta-binding protein 1-like n=1 Tax=Betta splendens TaxID=158456 RepID=A0A9W2Y6W6_BETSP|nr:latent-transforming growth factor beta-binding protein 1-like [Betta splendens]
MMNHGAGFISRLSFCLQPDVFLAARTEGCAGAPTAACADRVSTVTAASPRCRPSIPPSALPSFLCSTPHKLRPDPQRPKPETSFMAASSGPAAVLAKPGKNPDLNPTWTPADTLNKEHTPFSRAGFGGFEVTQTKTEEKDWVHHLVKKPGVSQGKEIKIKTVETRTKTEVEPEINNLQLRKGNSQNQEFVPMSDSQTPVEDGLDWKSAPPTRTEQREASEPPTKETPSNITNAESVLWADPERTASETEALSPEPNLGPTEQQQQAEDRLDPKTLGGSEPPGLDSEPGLRTKKERDASEELRKEVKGGAKTLLQSVREAQMLLLRSALTQGGRGDKLASLLIQRIKKERSKLGGLTSSASTFHTQRGRYSVEVSARTADGQQATGGGGMERIQVMFTPTICKVRCSHDKCVNYCERGNVTTLYSSSSSSRRTPAGARDASQGPGFRVSPAPSMAKVRVQHPPEASVKIHQVLRVPGPSPALRTLSSSSSGSAGAPAPASRSLQAPTVRGGGTHMQQSGFKYCFREVKDGQCSSPLPGLRSRDMCCRGIGKGWGITDCVLCPDSPGQSNSSCPAGFELSNGTQCVDVNECLLLGLCENGICVNTRGSYSCVCSAGFILDATHGICISHSVISEEKGQCFRVLGSGQGSSSCSLPILRNITKQICCCSRVGKAWGPNCQRCPHFGSAAFKESCPAGPGYHYSASALQFNQRVTEQLGRRGVLPVTHQNQGPVSGTNGSGVSRSQQNPSSGAVAGGASISQSSVSSVGSVSTEAGSTQSRPSLPQSPGSTGTTTQDRPQTPGRPGAQQNRSEPLDSAPSSGQAGGSSSSESRPGQPPARGDAFAPVQPPRPQNKPVVSPTTRPRVQLVPGVCDTRPGVCGRGLCMDQPGGKHSCVCDQGYQPNSQSTHCQDVNECVQSPGVCLVGTCVNVMGSYRCVCPSGYRSSIQQTSCQDINECQLNVCGNGRCENTPGSYRCVCHHGYRLTGNTCTDVDECKDPTQCPGQECINSRGSYRCVSCQPGYSLLNGLCADIDECQQTHCVNGRCENTPGSYRCVCRNGYRLRNHTCADVDECAEASQCPGQMCVNSVGSYHCVSCQPGYTLTNRQCTDVDECVRVEACDAERVCVNTMGSFRCDCPPGFRTVGLGRQCRDINECLEGDFCFSGGECVNTAGSYSCVCSQGFMLSDNGTMCLDVDECVKLGACLDGRCVNTDGSFQCQCDTGFTTNPEKTACLDVDECVSSGGSICGSQRCENTIGSFRCLRSCELGYRVTQTGQCVDVDECANRTVCGDHGVCHNDIGTYRCVCDPGFTSSPDTKACVAGPSSASSSSSFHFSVVELGPVLSPVARSSEPRDCYYSRAEWGSRSLLAANISQQECCCTLGEGWGLGSQHQACPAADTAEFLSLCPSGRGYVTTGPGTFSYTDVDECKRFQPEVCRNGVCVNNIPGYSCYCSSGYVYNSLLLECVDHNECEEESCEGGVCVNTVGSYYCSCPPPLVLDSTQRNCVNSSDLNVDENLSVCWQHLSADMMCQSPLLGAQLTYVDCCCLYGVGWGMECAICPPVDFEDYYYLCSSVRAPLFPTLPDSSGAETGTGRRVSAPPRFPSYPPDSLPPVAPDYDDYSPVGGSRSSFRGRTPTTYGLPDGTYRRPEYSTSYYPEGDYRAPDRSPFPLPADPRAERAFGARPLPSQPDAPPLRLAPLPGARYEEEEEEEAWRPAFPPFSERGGGTPRRVYERPYESYTGSTAEDCGILHGCENGRCVRVAEGYTCDCYPGYELDMTSMTCIDRNECEDDAGAEFPCVNARCVNTEGSFRCVCRRGYVVSRRPNHCVAA